MLNPYKNTTRPKIGRSVFNLSNTMKFTCDMGELIPCYIRELVPGDTIQIGHNSVIRFQPLVAPLLHEVYANVEDFFVPYRILWDDWEDFLTGGEDGTTTPTLPVWNTANNAVGSLWDYFGFPTGVNAGTGGRPTSFPLYAYNHIWNEYYRDQTQETEIAVGAQDNVLIRNWEKDYFTSALPWEQRGTAPSLPITGSSQALWPGASTANQTSIDYNSANSAPYDAGSKTALENNTVDLSSASTVDINELRVAFQTQKLLERAATGGSRMEEYIFSMYGTKPGDSRVDRAEWIGGMKVPIIFSEVLQTSEDGTTPQGNMAGHGISVATKRTGTYRAKEFGILISIFSVMPKPAYSQGVNKQWLKEDRYDIFNPLFSNLGEQPITHAELYTSATGADNITVFGYQGRYNEMRTSMDQIAGDLRSTYDYWHLGRQFSSKPSLNSTFLNYDGRKDIFAAPSADGLIVNMGNIVKAVRPLPIMPNPGYIDH